MSSPSSIETICFPIRKELERVEETLHAMIYSPVEMVTQVASHIIHSGGKRLRPILSVLAARLFNDDVERAIKLACAVEFIHTATLLHDDVIDNAELRRGRPSSNALWGNKGSVLVGDYLYCKASTIIANEGNFKVLKLIAEATSATTEGEVLEILKSNDPTLTEESYLEIIYYKTAILISTATQIGALLGGASDADQLRLRNYGVQVGMAFQLADDTLDYISSNSEIGKLVGTDLKEGKLTLPLIRTMSICNEEERKQVYKALENSSTTEEDLKKILTIIDKYQGIQYTNDKAVEYVKKAEENLSTFSDSPIKQSLIQLARYTIERRR